MSVLVDTSVWVDYLNGFKSQEAAALDRLLLEGTVVTCGVVVAEVFQGLRPSSKLSRLEARFRLLPSLEPKGFDAYFAAAALFRSLRKKGITIRSTIDCLIVTLAEEYGSWILAKDRDISAILESELVQVRPWPVISA